MALHLHDSPLLHKGTLIKLERGDHSTGMGAGLKTTEQIECRASSVIGKSKLEHTTSEN